MRSSELFRRRLVVIVLCCTFFVAVWRCVVTYARKTKEICVESTSVHANHFPLGKQTTNKTSSSSSSRFYSKKKPNERERERETPAKNDDQNASSLLLSERGMDVPCETLSKTRVLLCAHSRGGGFFLFVLFLGFRKKKRKKRRGEKGRGLCHSLLRAFVRSLRSRLFPPKALTTTTTTTTTTTRFVRGGGG